MSVVEAIENNGGVRTKIEKVCATDYNVISGTVVLKLGSKQPCSLLGQECTTLVSCAQFAAGGGQIHVVLQAIVPGSLLPTTHGIKSISRPLINRWRHIWCNWSKEVSYAWLPRNCCGNLECSSHLLHYREANQTTNHLELNGPRETMIEY